MKGPIIFGNLLTVPFDGFRMVQEHSGSTRDGTILESDLVKHTLTGSGRVFGCGAVYCSTGTGDIDKEIDRIIMSCQRARCLAFLHVKTPLSNSSNRIQKSRASVTQSFDLLFGHSGDFVILFSGPAPLVHVIEVERHEAIDEDSVTEQPNRHGIAHRVSGRVLCRVQLNAIC